MGLNCTKGPAVLEEGPGQHEQLPDPPVPPAPSSTTSSHFQPHYSLDDARSLHALSFTTMKNEEDSLVHELIQRSISQLGSDQDEAVNQLFQLIDAGVPLNKAGENGETPVFAAVRAGRLVMMEQLLANGASADAVNWHGSTPLHEACLAGQEDCVASLLRHNPSLSRVINRNGDMPMHAAAAAGHVGCVQRLLEGDPVQYDITVGALNNEGLAPVHLAAKMGRYEVLQQMHEYELVWRPTGASMEAMVGVTGAGQGTCQGTIMTSKDATGKTALMHAVIESQEDTVQTILMRGGDPNSTDNMGRTAQHYAVLCGSVSCMKSLLECGGDPGRLDNDGYTPFCYCSMQENSGSLVALLAECLLFRAVENGDLAEVQQAIAQIEHCSSLEPTRLRDFSGNLPLHTASRRGVADVVGLLAETGRLEDLRAKNDAGDLPIHVACRAGKMNCLSILLSIDPTLGEETTSSGDTCLHIAAKSGDTDLVTLLTATYKVSTEVKNLQENTPLHEAVCVMQYEPVKALLAAGADVTARDASGATSLDLAGDGGLFKDMEIYRLLSVMVEQGVVEEARGDLCLVGDLIQMSDDDMFEEMDSMDVCDGIGTQTDTSGARYQEQRQAELEQGAEVVEKAVRLPTPVAPSPFGALGGAGPGAPRGFQKFSSTLKRRTDDSSLESARNSLYIKPETLQVFRNHVLGEGSFGVVYLGILHGNKVAVKVFKRLKSLSFKKDEKSQERQQFLDELEAMSDLRHDNIQAVRGYCVLPEGRAIVSAYYDRGSLVDILNKGLRNPAIARDLTWTRRLRLASDIVKALMAMHNRVPPRVHRDLKAANCFVDNNWNAYLGDFGFACTGDSCSMWSKMGPTNPRWLSPEINLNSSFTEASDVYSFGMLMWELLTWKPPFARSATAAIYNLVAAGVRPEIPTVAELPGDPDDNQAFNESGALAMYVGIMKSCWAQSPSARIPTNQLFGELLACFNCLVRHVRAKAKIM